MADITVSKSKGFIGDLCSIFITFQNKRGIFQNKKVEVENLE